MLQDEWGRQPDLFEAQTNGEHGDEDEDSSSEDEDADIEYQDVQLFMHAIDEPQLADLFTKHKVTLGQLLEFSEQDLINCGVDAVGQRKKILENIGQMHAEKWAPASLQDLTSKTLLSSPGIYIALNDMNKHIEFIGINFRYLRKQLSEKPEILELGKDYVGVGKIASELKDMVKTIKTTYADMRMLSREVDRNLSDPTKLPANHIDAKYIHNAKMSQIVAQTLCATIFVGVSSMIARYVFKQLV